MAFTVNTRKVGNVVVVSLSGKLSIGDAVQSLRTTVRNLIDDGERKFVLDLGSVSHIDSAGLGELIAIYTSVRNRQGDVKLLNLDKKAKDLLQMTKLLTVFDTYREEQKALDALEKPDKKDDKDSTQG